MHGLSTLENAKWTARTLFRLAMVQRDDRRDAFLREKGVYGLDYDEQFEALGEFYEKDNPVAVWALSIVHRDSAGKAWLVCELEDAPDADFVDYDPPMSIDL